MIQSFTKNRLLNKSAFTIIEVVLVLAVAGLIFLVVFAAIPRLQASRRDNARKNDLRLFMAELENFRGNSGGARTTIGSYSAADRFNNFPFVNAAGGSSTYGVQDFCGEYMFLGSYSDRNSDTHDWKDPSTGEGYTCAWSAAPPTSVGGITYVWYWQCADDGTHVAASPASYAVVSARIRLERGVFCLNAGP